MINVYLKDGRTVQVDADKHEEKTANGEKALRFFKNDQLVAEFEKEQVAGWNIEEKPRTGAVRIGHHRSRVLE